MNKPLQYILNISALKTRLYPRVFCDHTVQKLLGYHCIKLHAFVWFPGPLFISAHPFSFNHVSTQIDCDPLFAWFPALKTPSPPLSHKSACYLFTEATCRVHLPWSPSTVNAFLPHWPSPLTSPWHLRHDSLVDLYESSFKMDPGGQNKFLPLCISQSLNAFGLQAGWTEEQTRLRVLGNK